MLGDSGVPDASTWLVEPPQQCPLSVAPQPPWLVPLLPSVALPLQLLRVLMLSPSLLFPPPSAELGLSSCQSPHPSPALVLARLYSSPSQVSHFSPCTLTLFSPGLCVHPSRPLSDITLTEVPLTTIWSPQSMARCLGRAMVVAFVYGKTVFNCSHSLECQSCVAPAG